MKKRTVTGKAESKSWRKNATLRDLLNLLDEIEQIDRHPEEKAKLRQRTIDYGQWLSEQIYFGKIKVPESDDNQTIKEFNNRFYSTYDTKGDSSYEEAKLPKGYYDKEGKFISVPSTKLQKGHVGAINPRWHPIPLKEEKTIIDPPIPPVIKKNKKSNIPWWVVIPVLGGALTVTYRQCTSGEQTAPLNPKEEQKDTIEIVTKAYTPAERDHLQYTVEKGKGLLAKQLGIKDEKTIDELYDLCVENIRQGKIPENMKYLTEKYQMSKMVDDELGINLDEKEITATGWLTIATSYDNVRQAILKGLLDSKEMHIKDSIKLEKRLSQANKVAIDNNADPRCSQVFTKDYGLFGAKDQIGSRIHKNNYVKYRDVVNRVFQDKDGQGY